MSQYRTRNTRLVPFALTPVAAALALSLGACGGGGGGTSAGAAPTAAFAGKAVDAPIANATITFTAGAPLGDSGASVIGTTTATGTGTFTTNVTLPSGSVPVFANATDPNNQTVVLSSYLGQSNALAAAGSLTANTLPDLDISPVTTAALAVYAATNGNSYANLSPTTYAAALRSYRSDILSIAAGIKAVGDNLCRPAAPVTTTTNLAATIAANSNLSGGTSTTLTTVASTLGGSCATVLAALPGEIAADPDFGPELDLGDVIDANLTPAIPAGTYALEGVIAETGATATTASTPGATPSPPAPAAVFSDAAVSVDGNGVITSTDGSVSGTVTGNFALLTVTGGAQQTYHLYLKLGILPSTVVTGGPAFVVAGGGTNVGTSVLTKFDAVLAPAAALPNWTAFGTAPSDSMDGVTCAQGSFPIRIDASFFGATVGGGSFGECIATSGTGWSMSVPLSVGTGDDFGFDGSAQYGMSTNYAPSFTASSWTEYATTATPPMSLPFILTANGSYNPGGASSPSFPGTAYYVMGTHTIVFSSTNGNGLLSLHGDAFKLRDVTEGQVRTADNSSSSDMVSSSTGDH